MKTYSIIVNEEQLSVMNRAMEVFTRIWMGQLDEAAYPEFHKTSPDYHKLRKGLEELRHLCHGFDGFIGSGHPNTPETFKISWDLHRVFRNKLAWEREPKGGFSVDFDNPEFLKESKTTPLARINKIE